MCVINHLSKAMTYHLMRQIKYGVCSEKIVSIFLLELKSNGIEVVSFFNSMFRAASSIKHFLFMLLLMLYFQFTKSLFSSEYFCCLK